MNSNPSAPVAVNHNYNNNTISNNNNNNNDAEENVSVSRLDIPKLFTVSDTQLLTPPVTVSDLYRKPRVRAEPPILAPVATFSYDTSGFMSDSCHPPEPTPTRSNNRQKNRKPTKGIGKGRPLKTEGPKKRRPKTVTTMKAAEIAHKYVTREMGVTPTVITFANKQLSSMSISDAPQDPAPSSATFAQEKTYFHL
ncbi:hypothetical protein GCK72_024998 [Caenorhabditis remanei]|uniref:Uncharacterized protein n=1 Tax=Caenorhabditis remanei TaxID=31234 RepID=A0A6A5G198_CAERE|nr:hypothetical protein GCK72_024998 [Caenorhabditis remanei]KAF1748531.1 hypothetical protein GCK72_024998 [Caenorhabditis remanei]